jgi:hypothetical protein
VAKISLQSHREDYVESKKNFRLLADAAKAQYYLRIIDELKNNLRRMFSVLDELLRNAKSLVLPPGCTDHELAVTFNNS